MKLKQLALLLLFASNNLFSQTIIWNQDSAPYDRETYAVAYSADGTKVISGSACHAARVRIWNSVDGNLVWDYQINDTLLCQIGVSFSSNGQYFASVEETGIALIYAYDAQTPELVATIDVGTIFSNIAFNPSGEEMATDGNDGYVRIFSLVTNSLINSFMANVGGTKCLAYSPDGNFIVTGGMDKTLKLFTSDGNFLTDIGSHAQKIISVRFSSDGNSIISASSDGNIKIWEKADSTWNYSMLLSTLQGCNQIDINNDGSLIAAAGNQEIVLFNASTGTKLAEFNTTSGEKVYSVSFNPANSSQLVSGNSEGKVTCWNLESALSAEYYASGKESIFLHPNPFSEQLRIYSEVANQHVVLYNNLGMIVKEAITLQGSTEINTTELPSGIYTAKINGTNKLFKVVKPF